MTSTSRVRGWLLVAVTSVMVASAAAVGCSSGSPASGGDGATATTVDPQATAAAYEGPGPYVAGTTTLDLDGRKVEVWYPAAPGAEQGQPKVVFEIRDLLPDQLKSLVPDNLNPKYETDAYRDIPASPRGPFPLVLFAHGFAGYPTEYQFLLTHLAQWGFVVAAPDFFERGLLAALTGATARTDEVAVMEQTVALLAAEDTTAGGRLAGAVDTKDIGTVGHSAGVTTALGTAAADPAVKTFVAMSGGLADGGASGSTGSTGTSGSTATSATSGSAGSTGTAIAPVKVPTQPGMAMVGGKDAVVGAAPVARLYDAMSPPKRFVQIDQAGHNSFDDLCEIGRAQGGLLEIAKQVGINPPDQISALFNDGCTSSFIDATQAWPVIKHFVTAQLRYELGLDPVPVGLAPGVVDRFAPVAVTYHQSP